MKMKMKSYLQTIFIFSATFFVICYPVFADEILPGRLGSKESCVARLGKCDVYFYMTPEKHELAKQMIQNVNENMVLTLGLAAQPCPTLEVLVQAIKYPEKDPQGTKILDQYAEKTQKLLEQFYGIQLKGISRYMNLNFNWEALKLHQDRFKEQYEYLSKLPLPVEQYTLVQDLTLIDWQMTKGTLSATMVQDGDMGDRFLICFFPNEVVGTFYADPAIYRGPYAPFVYPGHVTMPPHSTVPPMDLFGNCSSGSSKGKRMSTAVRGIVETKSMEKVRALSRELPVNRRSATSFGKDMYWCYDNGIILKPLAENTSLSLVLEPNLKIEDKENVDIVEISTQANCYVIQQIADLFNIKNKNNVKILHLIKRDGGFSEFNAMDLGISPTSQIILINHSELPNGYRHFSLAEDLTKKNLPWIQLYNFDPSMAMKVPYDVFYQLSLTPAEELLYRDEKIDFLNSEQSTLQKKIVTKIDLIIFS